MEAMGVKAKAWKLFHRLQSYQCIRTGVGISTSIGVEIADGVPLDSNSCVFLLKRCTVAKALSRGKQVHAHMIKTGLQVNMFIWNILINMYAKCQSMPDARKLFDKMSQPDIVSWTAVIAGYAQHGYACEALKHFCQMQRRGPMPNEFTFGSVLKASAGIAAAEEGKQIHAHVFKAGLEREVFAGSALVDMYAKCQNMVDARQVFEKMRERDEVSWCAMICGYAQNRCSEEAVRLFYDMKGAGLKMNPFALSSVLRY
jgi:pentatricopeptide repeat protein